MRSVDSMVREIIQQLRRDDVIMLKYSSVESIPSGSLIGVRSTLAGYLAEVKNEQKQASDCNH